ncbi:M14 family metallopeptidase [Denitromonas iodatirespirans]|uniref:Succinylglutamate desuccinylase/aspartoacylase family protein n=1 Tax=Denitromonas iodatirespirans TaxID=2795389 RepID=A0A944D7P5_DENI1|nr:M14 family metallopeptidase [Denitromonas iodatirespirans]MBT0961590.1 succinylglutamate desuccinylase/aspartoacylase family protein [Denitromonas iodatirespirans]
MDTTQQTAAAAPGEHYPIELEFPDIRAFAEGNRGIPYVFTFDSGLPGPHVMVNALTHGNEVCGAIVVKELLELGVRPRRGRLTLAFANVAAYERFDAAEPDASRFVDQDLNRVWTAAILDDLSRDSVELRRAREMRPLIDEVDFLLDLHSMHERSAPLSVCGPLDKGVALARALGTPAWVISDEGHPEGRRMRDYAGFGDPASPKNALLVECGQHWEAGAVDVGRETTGGFLVLHGIVAAADLPRGWLPQPETAQNVVRVTEPVVAASLDFRFAGDYTGLETFAEAGTIIAWRDGEPVRTPYRNCVLVMPSLRQLRPGVTVVRLGELIA